MAPAADKERKSRRERRRKKTYNCHCCRQDFTFCWSCRHCEFQICQTCMDENLWGVTCNNINWQCPDCGGWNGFGNQ